LVLLTRQLKQGDLQNGSVAVKRLLNSHTIDEKLFYCEATSMISVKHQNIVRLLGYCANTEGKAMANPNPEEAIKFIFAEIRERLLCFEYIKNGRLDRYIKGTIM
jgi:coatomer subunit beta'